MDRKFLTTFVVLAVILAAVAYFGKIYEGFSQKEAPVTNPSSSSSSGSSSYNHYTQQSTPTLSGTYYAQNSEDGSITVISQDALQLNLPNGESYTLVASSDNQEGFSTAAYGTFVVYTSSNGAKATIVSGADGQTVIRLQKPNGQVVYYSQNGAPNTYAQPSYMAPTGSTSSTTTSSTSVPASSTAPTSSTASGSSTSTSTSSSSTNMATTYPSSSSSYSSYPGQTTYNTYSPPTDYSSALPQGIPASQIPPGQQDLYILKSEVVPPVCPAQKNVTIYRNSSECPKCKCPAPQPCPESPFECKKVPNYNAINNTTLPVPVLPDFSTFGM